jgi:transposase InsO family protein
MLALFRICSAEPVNSFCQSMFERRCRQSGIRHTLTKPRSPTTIGKIERFHETLRKELFNKHTSIRSRPPGPRSTSPSTPTTATVRTR